LALAREFRLSGKHVSPRRNSLTAASARKAAIKTAARRQPGC